MKYQRTPTFDAAFNSTDASPATSYSWTHVLANQENKLIIVCAGGNRSASSVTLNTFTNFTRLTEVTGNGIISIWYLVYTGGDLNPTITVNFPSMGLTSGSSYSFYDAYELNSLTSSTSGGLSPSLAVSTKIQDIGFDVVQTASGGGYSFTVGAGQSNLGGAAMALAGTTIAHRCSLEAASVPSTTMSWTVTSDTGITEHAAVAVSSRHSPLPAFLGISP